jgi:hypothetical protein
MEHTNLKAKWSQVVESDLISDLLTLIMGLLFMGSSLCIILMAAGFIIAVAWAQAFPESAVLGLVYVMLQYSTHLAEKLIELTAYVFAAWVGSAAYLGSFEILYYLKRQRLVEER